MIFSQRPDLSPSGPARGTSPTSGPDGLERLYLSRRSLLIGLGATAGCIVFPQPLWAAAQATAVRLGVHDASTRVVLDLSQKVSFSYYLLSDPYRVVVDFPEMDWNFRDKGIFGGSGGLVSSLRFGLFQPGNSRIVFDLVSPSSVKQAFVLPPSDGVGWRFVMDLERVAPETFFAMAGPDHRTGAFRPPALPSVAAEPVPVREPTRSPEHEPSYDAPSKGNSSPQQDSAPQPAPQTSQQASSTTPPQDAISSGNKGNGSWPQDGGNQTPFEPSPADKPAATPSKSSGKGKTAAEPVVSERPAPLEPPRKTGKKPVIVLDPGHGGVDPGTTGVSGVYEKNITLSAAREFKAMLERDGRYTVHLTRNSDVFLQLRERPALGRQYGADMFISIHADANPNPSTRGLSVYTLSEKSSDSEAAALADAENKADIIAGIDLSHESPEVSNILINLAQRETMNLSSRMAEDIVDELRREVRLLPKTHRFAGFAVLKAPDVPAILMEMGYLSNEEEDRLLRTASYRAKLGDALVRAVGRYFASGRKKA